MNEDVNPVYAVNVRGWPGLSNWRPPYEPEPHGTGFENRVALVLHIAGLDGPGPSTSILGAYLLVIGPSIVEAGIIVPDGMAPTGRARVRRWARRHPMDTLRGPRSWDVCTLSEFFHPRTGLFMRTTYTGSGWCIGADLGRVLAMVAESITVRNEPYADMWELWLPGWGKVHDRGRIKRVSPHRPCLRMRSRRVGWQVEYGPVNLKEGYGMAEGTSYRKGEFLDLLSAAYVLDADRGASFAEHGANFKMPLMEPPLYVTPDRAGLKALSETVRGMHAFALFVGVAGSVWFPPMGDRHG